MDRSVYATARAVALALALILGSGSARADVPARPQATSAEIAQAKRLLERNGYSDIAVLSSDDQLVTLSARKDGTRSVLDVDPITEIILPHADLQPLPPIAGMASPR